MTRRAVIAGLVASVNNLNKADIDCALELAEICLNDKKQADWIATYPDFGMGFGRGCMAYVDRKALENGRRLFVAETSSKESYEKMLEFDRHLGFEETSRMKDFYEVGGRQADFVKRLC